MILFKFPKKKIVLDCFTFSETTLKTAPIANAIKIIPEWWKKLPDSYFDSKDLEPHGTMKRCVGMVEYYKKSIAMPLWTDLIIKINKDRSYNWQFSDMSSNAAHHETEFQATNFLVNYGHVKFITPWRFKCKEDIDWVWSHPTYNYPNHNDIVSFPGIVNYYRQYASNVNLMFPTDQPKKIFIPQGAPLAFITPMSDRKVEVVRHLVDDKEYKNLHSSVISFLGSYATHQKRRKEFSDCPFHNHTERK